MRFSVLPLVALLPLTAGYLFGGDEVIPQFPAFDRYEKMLRQSPFAPVTVVAAPPPEVVQDTTFASWFVVGVHSLGDTTAAIIENRENGERYLLKTGVIGPQDMTLVSVEWSKVLGRSKVTIRKGSQFGTLSFDQAQVIEPLVSQPMDSATALRNPNAPMGNPNPMMDHSRGRFEGGQGQEAPPRPRRRMIQAPNP